MTHSMPDRWGAFERDPNPQGFVKVVMPLLSGRIRKNIAATLGNLKRNLEAAEASGRSVQSAR